MATVTPIDHTADIGLDVVAPTAAEAFVAVAEAMFDFMVERDSVQPVERWEIELQADGWEDLLVAWLEELLYRYESERATPRECRVVEIRPDHLLAEVRGERLDPARHETKLQIKALTYHQLRAEQTAPGFEVRVIFDI